MQAENHLVSSKKEHALSGGRFLYDMAFSGSLGRHESLHAWTGGRDPIPWSIYARAMMMHASVLQAGVIISKQD